MKVYISNPNNLARKVMAFLLLITVLTTSFDPTIKFVLLAFAIWFGLTGFLNKGKRIIKMKNNPNKKIRTRPPNLDQDRETIILN